MSVEPKNTQSRERVAVRRRPEQDDAGTAPVLFRLPDLNRSVGTIPPVPERRAASNEPASQQGLASENDQALEPPAQHSRVRTTLTSLLERIAQFAIGSKRILVVVMVVLLIVLTLLVIQSTRPATQPDADPPIRWEQTVDGSAGQTSEPDIVFNETPTEQSDVNNTNSPVLFIPESSVTEANAEAETTGGPELGFTQLQNDVESTPCGMCYYSTDDARRRLEEANSTDDPAIRTAMRQAEEVARQRRENVAPQPSPTPQPSPQIPSQRGARYEDTGYPEFIPPRYRTSAPSGAGQRPPLRTGNRIIQEPRNERTGSSLY